MDNRTIRQSILLLQIHSTFLLNPKPKPNSNRPNAHYKRQLPWRNKLIYIYESTPSFCVPSLSLSQTQTQRETSNPLTVNLLNQNLLHANHYFHMLCCPIDTCVQKTTNHSQPPFILHHPHIVTSNVCSIPLNLPLTPFLPSCQPPL